MLCSVGFGELSKSTRPWVTMPVTDLVLIVTPFVFGHPSKEERGGGWRHELTRHVEVVGEVLDDTDDSEDLPEAARGSLEEGLRGDGVRLRDTQDKVLSFRCISVA